MKRPDKQYNTKTTWCGKPRIQTSCKQCQKRYLTTDPKRTILCPDCRQAKHVKQLNTITGKYEYVKSRKQDTNYYFKHIKFHVKDLTEYKNKKLFAVFKKDHVYIMAEE